MLFVFSIMHYSGNKNGNAIGPADTTLSLDPAGIDIKQRSCIITNNIEAIDLVHESEAEPGSPNPETINKNQVYFLKSFFSLQEFRRTMYFQIKKSMKISSKRLLLTSKIRTIRIVLISSLN